ncbi:MAG: sigma-70 family RNA polymerase sigma factor, partial [Flavobacteriales bacterium]|nr:sigma-70 family RNA polymerase sigma factor [Flavobacteriales bacterium]
MKTTIEHSSMTDKEIVKGCLKNSPDAQKALFERFSGRMMTLCLRYTGDQEDARDVLQEGFIKVFEKLNQFSGKGALGGWISTVMVNTALIHLRKKKREGYSTAVDEEYNLASSEVDVLSQLSANELMDLIQAMPTGYRT